MARITSIIIASLALAASAAATAGDIGNTPVLHIGQGNIMTSVEGSAFASVTTGKALAAKSRLMVAEDSSATVVYDNGCKNVYDKPGVYDISSQCSLAAAALVAGSAATAAAGGVMTAVPIVGAAVAGAAVLVNQPESKAAPISR